MVARPFVDLYFMCWIALHLMMVVLHLGSTSGAVRRMLRLRRGGPAAEREAAILQLKGLSRAAIRPREWDPELVRRAIGPADGADLRVEGLEAAFAHALDRGDVPGARAYRDALLAATEGWSPAERIRFRVGLVYFTAVHDRDAARARALLDAGELAPRLAGWHGWHLAHAAAAWVRGRPGRAAEELTRAEAALSRCVDGGRVLAAADQVAALRGMLSAGVLPPRP